MKQLAIKSVLILAISHSAVLKAEETRLQCKEPLYIVYMNGVFNNYNDALNSKIELQKRLISIPYSQLSFSSDNKHFILVHNKSYGLLDLFEAFLQKRNELDRNFLRFMNQSDRWPSWFKNIYQKAILNSYQPGHYEMSQLQNLINEIIIMGGGKVLLVAHSQGNFFANEAVQSTRNSILIHWETDQEKVHLVSVATPTSSVEGDGSYTTLKSDAVIGVIPTALPGNSSNTKPIPGLFDHEFVKHYLHGDSSGSQIFSQALDEIGKLSKIGKSDQELACNTWFRSTSKDLGKNANCLVECSSFPVDMDTFGCHSQCSRLCKCEMQ